MHYGILAYGSRGDIQPFLALALGLVKNGHQVTFAAPENFKDFVESYGINYFPLYGNMEKLLYSPEALKILKSGSTFTLVRHLQKSGDEIRPKINQDLLKASQDTDVLITSTLNLFYVASIAEKLNKKWAILFPNPPGTPTREFPFPDLDFMDFPLYNILTYKLVSFVYWQSYKKRVNEFRKSLGLQPAMKNMLHSFIKNKILTLYNFSQELIKQPKDWGSHCQITGYLTLTNKQPDNNSENFQNEISEWLQNGEKPIYIGFGSIPVPDPTLLSSILNEMLLNTNLRVILCKGWSEIPNLPTNSNLLVVDYINHQWLLPKCRVSIFHGGAGTLAATLEAKIPAIIISIFGDQSMWGKIVERKKIGIHIPFKNLTTKRLLKAINDTGSEAIKLNSLTVGQKINAEDGLKLTIEKLESYFA
jgi:sterol 3beta-glucosyltransferase